MRRRKRERESEKEGEWMGRGGRAEGKELLSGVGVTQAEACQNRDGAGEVDVAGGVAGSGAGLAGTGNTCLMMSALLKRQENLSSQPELQFPLQFQFQLQFPTR